MVVFSTYSLFLFALKRLGSIVSDESIGDKVVASMNARLKII